MTALRHLTTLLLVLLMGSTCLWAGYEEGVKEFKAKKYKAALAEFQTELKASRLAARILAECGKLVSYGGRKPALTNGPNKKIAGKVRGYAGLLFKKYGDSQAATRVKTELESYGFKI